MSGNEPVEGTERQEEDRTPVRTGRHEKRRQMMELEAGRAGIDGVLKCPTPHTLTPPSSPIIPRLCFLSLAADDCHPVPSLPPVTSINAETRYCHRRLSAVSGRCVRACSWLGLWPLPRRRHRRPENANVYDCFLEGSLTVTVAPIWQAPILRRAGGLADKCARRKSPTALHCGGKALDRRAELKTDSYAPSNISLQDITVTWKHLKMTDSDAKTCYIWKIKGTAISQYHPPALSMILARVIS